MTISLVPQPPVPTDGQGHADRIRCDICGRAVIDPDAHLIACLDYELAMFTIGRRAS